MSEHDAEDEAPSKPAGAPAWMATFGDLMSLLFVFFVLLLSFANMDIVKFKDALGSMRDAFGVQIERPGEFQARSDTIVEMAAKPSSTLIDALRAPKHGTQGGSGKGENEIAGEIARTIRESGLDQIADVKSEARGVVMRVRGQLLFEPGSDRIRPESLVFLDEITQLVLRFPYAVTIEGHTDDAPVGAGVFATNWHLSAGRAIAVLRYLHEAGGVDARRLSASAMADQRPLVPNDSPAHRAVNRRVEFVFQRESIDRGGAGERQVPVLSPAPGGLVPRS